MLADPFNRKVESHLGDRVILKPLTRWNEAYKEFPRYVMEYLVSRYVDAEEPVAGQRKIDKILSEHYTESAKKELIKSRIKENGEYTLLGQLTVRLDQARDHYWADVPALGDNTVRVGPKILEQYRDVLMTSGAWGTMVIEYDATYEIKSRKYPFYVREFTPLQYTRLDLDDYIAKRPLFTEDEWLDLLVQSIGFNPARFDRRVKMLMLLRLVPFVEANYNLIELGPRETGKTYTFRNTSSRSFVVSGGKATPATLFYNKATRKLGVIGLKQVVFFDEIASTRFEDAEASVSVLKDYMQTGKFTRGDQEFSAQCSVVLGGNIDTDVAAASARAALSTSVRGTSRRVARCGVSGPHPRLSARMGNAQDSPGELRHRLRVPHGLYGRDLLRAAAAQFPDTRGCVGGPERHDRTEPGRHQEDGRWTFEASSPPSFARNADTQGDRTPGRDRSGDARARHRPVGQDAPGRIRIGRLSLYADSGIAGRKLPEQGLCQPS